MCIFLLSDITKTIARRAHIGDEKTENYDFSILHQLKSVREIKNRMKMILYDLVDTVIPESRIDNDPIIHQAKKYINDYIGVNITAQEIANRLHMNFSYFSSYFKEKTGMNFRTYLSDTRNAYAKSLLEDPQFSIDDVSQALGYTDYRSFCRNFKKCNGITPSSFKRRKQGKKP